MKSLTIIGRRWFQRGPGNTYHTSEIIVDGKCVHKTVREYGYGSQYEQTASAWLEANGHLPALRHYESSGGTEPLWQYCRERGIAFESRAIDVSRQKDL